MGARFLTPEERRVGGSPIAAPVFNDPEPATFFGEDSYVRAAYERQSTIFAATQPIKEYKPDPSYTPLEDDRIRGTYLEELHLDRFLESYSREQSSDIISRIEREDKNRNTLARGGMAGMAFEMLFGAADPTIVLPVAGYVAKTAQASRAAKIGIAEGAIVTGGAVAAQEAILQMSQETRSTYESLFNVAAGTVLGGILGGAARGLSKSQFQRMAEELDSVNISNDVDDVAIGPSDAGAAATDARRAEQKSTFGMERLSKLTPLGRALGTKKLRLVWGARTALDLVPTGRIPLHGEVSTEGGDVFSRAQVWGEGLYAIRTEDMRKLYSQYRFGRERVAPALRGNIARMAGDRTHMTLREFNESVSKAILEGDALDDALFPPEVIKAAKISKAFTQKLTERYVAALRKAGKADDYLELLAKGSADLGYLHRIWNQRMVSKYRAEFVDIVRANFARVQDEILSTLDEAKRADFDVLDEQALVDVANQVADRILGMAPNRAILPGDLSRMIKGPRGAQLERALHTLPTNRVRKFVERDIDVIDKSFARTMAIDTELLDKFGSVDIQERLAKINDEVAERAAKMPDGKEKQRLQNYAKQVSRDLNDMVDIMRGTYKLPDEPDGLWNRAGAAIRALNFMTSLGMVVISSIPDAAKIVFEHGLSRSMRTVFAPFVGNLQQLKLARRDARLLNAGVDMVGSNRIQSIFDVLDEAADGTVFERTLQAGARGFGYATGLNWWNATVKQITGVTTISRGLDNIAQIARGKKLAKGELERLRRGGISDNLAHKIWKQFEAHGTKEGELYWPNVAAWTDDEARTAFGAFVTQEVDRIIVTPGPGDLPKLSRDPIGRVLLQFQAFALSSYERTVLSGLAQRDGNALVGTMLMLGLGALSYKLKSDIAGYETSDDPRVWAREAFDNSGLGAWVMNVNNAVEKITGNRVGIGALTGEPARRYINVNWAGAFLGPTFGKAVDLQRVIHGMSTGEPTASTVHAARKLIPAQNLFYFRWLFNQAEKAVVDAAGIPERRAN